jgi:hypothetical protein
MYAASTITQAAILSTDLCRRLSHLVALFAMRTHKRQTDRKAGDMRMIVHIADTASLSHSSSTRFFTFRALPLAAYSSLCERILYGENRRSVRSILRTRPCCHPLLRLECHRTNDHRNIRAERSKPGSSPARIAHIAKPGICSRGWQALLADSAHSRVGVFIFVVFAVLGVCATSYGEGGRQS